MPATRDQRSDVLYLAQQVRRDGRKRGQAFKAVGRGERKAEADCGRASTGYQDAEGSGWKKMVSPEEKRAAVGHLRQEHGASERRACGLVNQPRSSYRYQHKEKAADGLRERIAKLAAERPRFGYRRLTALLQREGVRVWHGRVHRITKELRLQVPRRKRKRIRVAKAAMPELTRANQCWGMDFVSDSLADGARSGR